MLPVRLRHTDVFSAQHLKHAVPGVLAPGILLAGDAGPDAVVGCQLVGGGLMVAAALPAHAILRHQRQHLAAVAADDINVAIVVEGSARLEAAGWQARVRAGDILYMPASWSSTLHTEEACRMLVLRLSLRRFNNGQGGKFSDFAACLALRDSALRLAVCHYVEQVLPALSHSALATVAHAEQAFIALLAGAHAEATHAAAAPARSRWDTLVAALDGMLHDADLDVGSLAAALGMTPRHVHRLFAAQGVTYSGYVLAQRLARARDDLRRPMLRGVGVAQIGYRAGFNSASHFSRSFKQRYGMAPLAWRAAA